MSKKFKPFLAHSELTDCIYIIDGNDKYEVTEQCIKAMKATNRMPNVLDKIRAEIDSHCSDNRDRNDGLYIAMKIIDKYIAEGSETWNGYHRQITAPKGTFERIFNNADDDVDDDI